MCRLLVKLNEVATTAAVGLCHVLNASALKIVLLADGGALHARKDTVQAGHTEQEALERTKLVSRDCPYLQHLM